MGKGMTFVAGAAVGAIAALLLSPNSGERNRELVAEKVDYYSSNGSELFQRAGDAVRDKVHPNEQSVPTTTDDIRAKINEARDRIAEQVTRNRSAQDVEADVSDIAQDVAEDTESAAE